MFSIQNTMMIYLYILVDVDIELIKCLNNIHHNNQLFWGKVVKKYIEKHIAINAI